MRITGDPREVEHILRQLPELVGEVTATSVRDGSVIRGVVVGSSHKNSGGAPWRYGAEVRIEIEGQTVTLDLLDVTIQRVRPEA